MSNTSKQLENVFQEVATYFATIPPISVTPGEGTPPEQYSVSYQVQGVCKEEGGEVYPCDKHVISISLPFGFPHFPPNCRPETPTFHPDFDTSAICIGDTWQADQSITKLILHIGHMISGEFYSLTNAFNEEAAEWYQEHSDRLPFDQPTFAASPSTQEEDDTEITVDEIDILDDEDFSQSFTLEKDDESSLEDSPPPLSATIDIDRLRSIARQKHFHALSQELQSIETHFNGREELELQVQMAMDKATNLYREADDLEHRGEQKKAAEKYQAVGEIVSDYPLLQEAKERVQQSLDLLGDWVTGEEPDNEAATQQSPEEPPIEKTPSSQKGERTFYEEKKSKGGRWILYAIGGGSIALLTTVAISYFSLGSSFTGAQQNFNECQTLLAANKFAEAERKCEEALDLISSVRVVKQDEKKILVQEIRSLLASEKLRQGLAGKTLLDGQFVSESTKQLILAFREAKEEGDTLFQQQIWEDAVLAYEKALDITTKTTAIDKALTSEVRKQLPRARFNAEMLAGEKSLSISDWDEASTHFNKALELAKTDSNVTLEDIVQLELLSNQVKFNILREQGHKFFNNNEWLSALDSYQRALELVEKLNLSESTTISDLHENIARTKIYMTVEKGQKAFAAAQWDEAIKQYEQAIILLEENSKLLSQINTKDSRGKLSRIMLHASIIRDKQDVAKHLKSEKYGPALAKLQNIKKSITASPFAEQPEFQSVLQEISSQIQAAEKQLLINEKTTYLLENFSSLFLKHYPASAHSVLSSPKVEYLKKMDKKYLFRMQCTEESGGRRIRLQMNYLYSPANDTWEFYSSEE